MALSRAARARARARTAETRRAIGIDMDDRAFLRALRQAADRMQLRSERDLLKLGYTVQNTARQLCPVDTGRLRASISTSGLQRDARGAYIEVGTNVSYAPYVEFGTQRSPAQPYLRPALLHAMRRWGR